MKKKIAKNLTLIVFLVMLFDIAITNVLLPDQTRSESENRVLQTLPKFSLSALFNGTFTSEFESYVTDQFMFRDGFVGLKTASEYLLQKKDTNGVYFAKDGYLIEKHDETNTDISKYNKNIFQLSEFLNRQAETFSKEHVFFMPIPSADNVLSDKLPAYAPYIDQQQYLSKIANDTSRKFQYVDVMSALSDHSSEYIYYKTDHHWTTKGAYYGYEAFCKAANITAYSEDEFNIVAASDSFYGTIYSKARLSSTKPDTIYLYEKKSNPAYKVDCNNGEEKSDSLYDMSYLDKKDKYSVFLGGNKALVTVKAEDADNEKSILVIKDSYAHSMIPFLVNNYGTVHMIDLRYYNGDINEFIKENNITDVLALYSFSTLTSDNSFAKLNR